MFEWRCCSRKVGQIWTINNENMAHLHECMSRRALTAGSFITWGSSWFSNIVAIQETRSKLTWRPRDPALPAYVDLDSLPTSNAPKKLTIDRLLSGLVFFVGAVWMPPQEMLVADLRFKNPIFPCCLSGFSWKIHHILFASAHKCLSHQCRSLFKYPSPRISRIEFMCPRDSCTFQLAASDCCDMSLFALNLPPFFAFSVTDICVRMPVQSSWLMDHGRTGWKNVCCASMQGHGLAHCTPCCLAWILWLHHLLISVSNANAYSHRRCLVRWILDDLLAVSHMDEFL